jgi:hypothetical protein
MAEPDTTPDENLTARPVPASYFNGFLLNLSNADVGLLTLLDNQPVLKVNMSYTVAKTLMLRLQEAIETLEKSTGRKIMTTDDAGEGLTGGGKVQ